MNSSKTKTLGIAALTLGGLVVAAPVFAGGCKSIAANNNMGCGWTAATAWSPCDQSGGAGSHGHHHHHGKEVGVPKVGASCFQTRPSGQADSNPPPGPSEGLSARERIAWREIVLTLGGGGTTTPVVTWNSEVPNPGGGSGSGSSCTGTGMMMHGSTCGCDTANGFAHDGMGGCHMGGGGGGGGGM